MRKGRTSQAQTELSPVYTWSVLFLVFIALLAKGLYNEEVFLVYGIIVSSLFLYSLITKKRNYDIGDALLLLLAFSYAISASINAANPRAALFHVLSIFIYFMFYNLIKLLHRDEESALKIYYAVTISILFLIFIGAVKRTPYASEFEFVLGYLNSFAAAILIAIIISLYAIFLGEIKLNKIMYIFDYSFILAVISLVITKSRGGFLTLILVLLSAVVINRRQLQKAFYYKITIYLFISVIAGTLVTPLVGMKFIIALTILPVVIMVIINTILKNIVKYRRINKLIFIGITIIGTYVFYQGQLYTRLSTLGITDFNTIARYLFYIDGLQIFQKYPIFGTGGGGWLSLYQQYQGHAYNTLEAHSFLIQYLVEGGLLGTVIFMAFILTKWFWYIQARIRKETFWYQDCAFIITLAILAHALIDIDLSFPAFNIILFSMFAFLPDRKLVIRGKRIQDFVAYVIPVIVLITFMLAGAGRFMTNSFYNDSADGLSIEEIRKYESRYALATKLDPFNSEYYNYLAQMQLNLGRLNSDKKETDEGLLNIDKSIKYLPNFVDTYIIRAQIMESLGKEEEAVYSYKAAINKAPLKNNSYDYLINYYFKLGVRHSNPKYFHKAEELINLIRKQMDSIEEDRQEMWIGDYLGYSNSQCYYAGLACYYLQDYSQGVDYLKDAELSSGYRNLPEEMKKRILGLINIGERRAGTTPKAVLEADYISELEDMLDKYKVE